MADPIRVDFQVGGIREVQQAFNSVIEAANKAANVTRRAASAQKSFNKETAQSTASAEKQKQDAVKKTAETSEKEARATRRMIAGTINGALTEFLNAKAKETEAARKAAESQLRATEVAERRRLAVIQNTSRLVQGIYNRDARGRFTAGAGGGADLSGGGRSTGGVLGGIGAATATATRSAISRVAGVAGLVTGVMGGFTVADAAQRGLEARGAAADLSNQSGRKVSGADILANATRVGTQFGTDTLSVIAGLDAFVAKSGDAKAGMEGLSQLVELATATGADLRELSQTAGIIHMGTGNMADTLKQMRVLSGAGREGSVDMRELSQYAGRISSGANQFVSKGAAFSQLSAIVQQAAATGGATAAPEATEAVTRLATDVFEKEAAFQQLGIQTRDKSGKYLVDPMEIIKQSIVKSKGDSATLLELFGKMSYRAVAGFQDVYNRAGGGKTGEAAIDAAFKKFINAELTEATVREDASKRIEEADKQFAIVMNDLRDKVAAEVVPALIKLAPQIKELIPAFVSLVKYAVEFATWLKDNPIKGLGAIIVGQVVADLASVAIGSAVAKAITELIFGATLPAAAAGAAGLPGATTAAAGAGAAAGVGALGMGIGALSAATVGIGAAIGGGIGYEFGDALSGAAGDEKKKELQGSSNRRLAAFHMIEEARKDKTTLTDEDAERKNQERLKKLKSMLAMEESEKRIGPGNMVSKIGTVVASMNPFDDSNPFTEQQRAYAQENALRDESIKDLKAAIEKLTTEMATSNSNKPQASMLRVETVSSMATPQRASQ